MSKEELVRLRGRTPAAIDSPPRSSPRLRVDLADSVVERRPARRARWRIPVGGGAVALLILVAAQFVLPVIATEQLTSSLSRNGTGVRVSLSAFPALELLFGEADSVKVQITRFVSRPARVGHLLARTAKVGRLTALVGELDTHGLVLHDVRLEKRGDALLVSATVTRVALQAVLPPTFSLGFTRTGSNGLEVRARARVFSHNVIIRAGVRARGGNIVLYPLIPGIGALLAPLHITLFSSSAVTFESVSVVQHRGSFTLTVTGLYR
jgi:hypothetical protein